MKTVIKRKIDYQNGKKGEELLICDPPYTIFGSTPPPEYWSVIMKVDGLRKMLDEFDLKGDDSFRITISELGNTYSFIKNEQ
jgi:hypothetical protein